MTCPSCTSGVRRSAGTTSSSIGMCRGSFARRCSGGEIGEDARLPSTAQLRDLCLEILDPLLRRQRLVPFLVSGLEHIATLIVARQAELEPALCARTRNPVGFERVGAMKLGV